MASHDEKYLIKKYLSIYSDDQLVDIHDLKLGVYSHVLVIPAYREDHCFVENIRQFAQKISEFPLIIVVVNQPPPKSADDVAANQPLISMLCDAGDSKSNHQNTRLITIKNLSVLVTPSLILDEKKGVGLARKIGCDLALRLIDMGIVRCPIVYTTDADALLPDDYFSRAETACTSKTAGFTYPFTHVRPPDRREQKAIELYEKRLYYYVAGLTEAGSPYAFHSIGSTIAIDAKCYAMVRGFPKMAAGEDFYVLNKLRKVGAIISLSGNPIELSARMSSRVPFGTGPALFNILQHEDEALAPIFYHPSVYDYLGHFLRSKTEAIALGQYARAFSLSLDASDLVHKAAFSLRGYEQLGHHLCSRRTAQDRLKAFHDWFDAFRTLKFIHFIKNAGFFMCNEREVINQTREVNQLSIES